MAEWTSVKLGNVINIRHGFAFKGEFFGSDPAGPILVTPGNFAIGGGFKETSPKSYSGEIPEGFALYAGDLVVTMTDLSKASDTLGYPAFVPEGVTYLHNQRVGRIEVTVPDVVSKEFLGYALRGDGYRRHVVGGATGTTVKHTSPGRICEYEILMPPLQEQQAIATALGALDDKIAVNERIAATADDLSRALFGEVLLKSADGFSDQPLSAVAEFINGRAFTKDATGTGRMVARIAEINSGPGVSTVYNEIDVPDRHLARPGDLLFAWSGSLTAARWFRPEAIINQHIFKCIPRGEYPIWLVSQLVHRKLDEFRSIAADKATTMGHIQRRHLDEPVPVPRPKTLGALDCVISPLWERALVAEKESLSLATLRDTLLPQLMTGRLRVKDAEKIVEDHV
ncbi:restriction endonuclease subunit S [Streptomyces sp. RK9]|uniref:restriction endonuclease subunit S n=1 Tax=Streptomyces sp. RK9 TaxID=3239284 RepID=UPI0038667F35